jgi:cell shape-determining protein MreC
MTRFLTAAGAATLMLLGSANAWADDAAERAQQRQERLEQKRELRDERQERRFENREERENLRQEQADEAREQRLKPVLEHRQRIREEQVN